MLRRVPGVLRVAAIAMFLALPAHGVVAAAAKSTAQQAAAAPPSSSAPSAGRPAGVAARGALLTNDKRWPYQSAATPQQQPTVVGEPSPTSAAPPGKPASNPAASTQQPTPAPGTAGPTSSNAASSNAAAPSSASSDAVAQSSSTGRRGSGDVTRTGLPLPELLGGGAALLAAAALAKLLFPAPRPGFRAVRDAGVQIVRVTPGADPERGGPVLSLALEPGAAETTVRFHPRKDVS